ncbi:MAG TPA: condensation domain-containing protein, partial [Ktedonobacteraceae bacterium]|nr:condensation domain-containing protein [Ktedonobacteraceae bacterium]
MWSDVLKLDQVGRHDNFFELGGHSLLAIRVMTRLKQTLGMEITITDLFAHPVLTDLAHRLEDAAACELPPITPAERSGHLPVSFAQQRVWFLAQMDGVSEAYHIPFGIRIQGQLDPVALRQALDRILVRHEVLRTTFSLLNGEPVQRIAPAESVHFELIEHDLCHAQDALDHLIIQEASNSFDLEAGPLIRGRLLQLTADEHVLLITMHHIVSDGWSMGIFLNELGALYAAFREGHDDPLPALELQYADYALWQRNWIEGDLLQQQAEYWKTALAGAPALLELPTDHPRPAQKEYAGAFAQLVLDEQLTAGLKALSRRHSTTLYMTLLAAWAALLARLSGQQDIVIGTPVANRTRSEIEGLIGFFVNTLALRLDLSGSPSVGELLDRVKIQALAAQQHQDIPFEQVVELARPTRSLAHSPLFQVMFAWQNNPQANLELPGLKQKPLRSAPQVLAKFDLTLFLQEANNCIAGGLEYATSLFEASTIERYLGYLRNLLQAMVTNDTQMTDKLSLLPATERHQLLYEWNDTRTEFPSDRCIHQLFEQQVAKTPAAIAVVFEEDALSYQELNRRSNQLAHYLRELGVRPDTPVALCVERGLEMIVGLLAVLKAGGAYVPLDPAYPLDRLRFMLDDSAPVALLTQTRLRATLPELSDTLPLLDLDASTPPWHLQPDTNPDPIAIGLTPQHLAYIIYTSGSTGLPKGVMVEHRSVCNRLVWMQSAYHLDLHAVVLQRTPFSFDVSVWEFFCTLITG